MAENKKHFDFDVALKRQKAVGQLVKELWRGFEKDIRLRGIFDPMRTKTAPKQEQKKTETTYVETKAVEGQVG